jgi:hypothetical protein
VFVFACELPRFIRSDRHGGVLPALGSRRKELVRPRRRLAEPWAA